MRVGPEGSRGCLMEIPLAMGAALVRFANCKMDVNRGGDLCLTKSKSM
jgi:hypothetical protein